jgi:hypothetical protein
MSTLAFSVIASIVLTIGINVVLRVFPDTGRRLRDGAARLSERSADEALPVSRSNARVIVPWKAMLIASVVLTVAINVVLFVLR